MEILCRSSYVGHVYFFEGEKKLVISDNENEKK